MIQKHFRQMTRKLRVDFRYNRGAVVGYAVLSYVDGDKIRSLVAEVKPQEK